jgi:uncharacterized protein
MILDIQQLRDTEDLCLDMNGQQCHFPSDAGRLRAPIHLEARVRKIEPEIVIEGRISTMVEMQCARCLKSHNQVVNDTFEAIYRPKSEVDVLADELELDEADLDIYAYEDESISISDLLRDQLLLLLPVKPLCKPDCAGLCPSCGKNLNKGLCGCAARAHDPRFAMLGHLLHKDMPEQQD